MKKTKLTLVVIFGLLIIAGGIFGVGCEKDTEQLKTDDDAVLERILDFKEDAEKPNNLKSGGEDYISVEDAVWVVEAALNYTYCVVSEEQAEAGANEQIIDSLFF